MNQLQNFIVLYRDRDAKNFLDEPLAFRCFAEDLDHAEEQCMDAYPNCIIGYCYLGNELETALDNYYGNI